jgi:Flp pilus assembly protein TadG
MKRQPLHGERGATWVEFAIAGTFAIMIMFGILDFGRAMSTYDQIAYAARIGTRYASVNGSASCSTSGCAATASQIQTYVRNAATGIDSSKLTVTTVWASSSDCTTSPYQGSGCDVSVTVAYTYSFLTLPIAPIVMSSSSRMTLSQ